MEKSARLFPETYKRHRHLCLFLLLSKNADYQHFIALNA